MNISTVKGVKLEAVTACVPKNKVSNQEFAKQYYDGDLTPLLTSLGIETRHVCAKKETTALDMCCFAGSSLLNKTGLNPDEIGALIFVTQTPDSLVPNNASVAQSKLGLSKDILAFDINHACSGYIYGLYIASLIASNQNRKVLLLDGDSNSRYSSPLDKGTAFLFGDAGTASLISPDNSAKDWFFSFNTDGDKAESVIQKLGYRWPITSESLEYIIDEEGNQRRQIDMYMDGAMVFAQGYKIIPEMIQNMMDELETSPEEYDCILAHQANALLLRKITKKVGFDAEKNVSIIKDYGNSSSSCIPMLLSQYGNKYDHPILWAIGGGLSIAVADISIEGTKVFGISEQDF